MDGESVRIRGFSNRAWAEHAIGELRDLGLSAELDLADGDCVTYALIVRGCEEKLRMLRALADADEAEQGCMSLLEGSPSGSIRTGATTATTSGTESERMTPASEPEPERTTPAPAPDAAPQLTTAASGSAPRFAWCDFVNAMDGLLPS